MPPTTTNSSQQDQDFTYTRGKPSTNNNTSTQAPASPANEAPEEYLEDSDSDDDTEEPGYAYGKYRVNLREAKETNNWGPVFDKELFKIIGHMREQALKGEVKAILYPDLLGNLQAIWERPESGEYNIFTLYATQIDLYKGSHTEMPHKRLPEIQNEPPYQRSTMIELLHKYNPGKEWIPCPFVLQNVKKTVCKIHLNEGAMKKSHADLNYTLRLWQKSQARIQLERRFYMASQGSVQIKKIVCLGLGSFLEPDMSTPGLLQHLAAFTIARKLNDCYKSVDPNCPPIKIFAQDPSYSESDRILLQRIDPITFVSDPQGLLEIDENTLVISFGLPFEVPLMQMLPDIFEPNGGPAGILSDTLHLDPTRSVYRYRRRDSPSVEANDEDRLWSRSPADQSYFASDFKTDEDLVNSLTQASENSPDNFPDPYQLFAVNLYDFNQERDYKQILEDALRLRRQARHNRNNNEGQTLTYKDFNGREWVIWVAPEYSRQHMVHIHWFTRTELHEDFHTKMPFMRLNGFKEQLPYEYSPAIQLLHQYNPTASLHDYAPVPFVFENIGTSINILPPSKIRLFTTADLWAKSDAAQHFRDLVTSVAFWAISIRKIVCFGLGTRSTKAGFYGGVLQHMAIFTMARQLNTLNPSLPKVHIIVQDPAYTPADHIIINRLYSDPCVTFKDDPEALLATDEHTLVVAPFLPKAYPLMQILALKAREGGPAGFLCDDMDLDENTTHYTCMDRDSPEVTMMLKSGRYRNVIAALRHQLDENVFRDVYGENEAY